MGEDLPVTQDDADVAAWLPVLMTRVLRVFWFMVDLRDDCLLIFGMMNC